MSKSTATVPAVKNALLARFKADAGLAGVQVFRQDPYPLQPDDEQVVIANARPVDALRDSSFPGGQSSATIGRRSREERYVVNVVCRVLRTRQSDPADVEDRAYELAAVVQQNVDAWADTTPKPFDGLVIIALVVSTEDDHGLNAEDKREGRVTVGIGCSARINL